MENADKIILMLHTVKLVVYPAEVLELVGESPTLLRRAFQRGKELAENPAVDSQEEHENLLDRLELAREEAAAMRDILTSRHGWDPVELKRTVRLMVLENVQANIDRLKAELYPQQAAVDIDKNK